MRRTISFAMAIVALILAFGLTPAGAQGYPERTITMIVPFPPGGPSDVVARIMADGMGRALGNSIVIEKSAAPAAQSAPRGPQPRRPTATRCSAPAWDRMSRRRRHSPI